LVRSYIGNVVHRKVLRVRVTSSPPYKNSGNPHDCRFPEFYFYRFGCNYQIAHSDLCLFPIHPNIIKAKTNPPEIIRWAYFICNYFAPVVPDEASRFRNSLCLLKPHAPSPHPITYITIDPSDVIMPLICFVLLALTPNKFFLLNMVNFNDTICLQEK
jgi:hypothetical protein